jgi:hypothetical protein
LSYLITAVVSLIVPIAIGVSVYHEDLWMWFREWRMTRGAELAQEEWEREQRFIEILEEAFADEPWPDEGRTWCKCRSTAIVTENPGGFGFLIVARDGQGNDVYRMTDRPLAGIPFVERLDELVSKGRAWFIAHNCGYPLVYACRARDLPSAGLDGDEWLRVEACDAS